MNFRNVLDVVLQQGVNQILCDIIGRLLKVTKKVSRIISMASKKF